MIRFVLDMRIVVSTGQFLRAARHDVVHMREVGLERLSDEGIVAEAEHRVIVTAPQRHDTFTGQPGSGVRPA